MSADPDVDVLRKYICEGHHPVATSREKRRTVDQNCKEGNFMKRSCFLTLALRLVQHHCTYRSSRRQTACRRAQAAGVNPVITTQTGAAEYK